MLSNFQKRLKELGLEERISCKKTNWELLEKEITINNFPEFYETENIYMRRYDKDPIKILAFKIGEYFYAIGAKNS